MANTETKLEMYGGSLAASIPLIIAVIGFVVFSVYERGAITAFWVSCFIGILVGILFAKNKRRYAQSVFEGISRGEGAAIYVIWIFAGVLGQIWRAGGMIDGMVWLGSTSGATGMWFVLVTFVISCLLATGLGTSVGTVVALAPVLYPAGIVLGADPLALALALIAGGAFGDNLGPISDTTIVSSVSQGAEIGDVVKSRFPLAIVAATIAAVILLIIASMGASVAAQAGAYEIKGNPLGLIQLVSLVALLAFAISGRHIVESVSYSIIIAAIIGIGIGAITLTDLVHIPDVRGGQTGLIQKGIASTTAPIIFVMLILGITQVMINAGVMDRFINWAKKTVAKSVRQAEASVVLFTILITIPLAANAPGILIMADYAKRIAEEFKLHAARAANLLDCAANTAFYMLPWHNAVIAWYTAVAAAAAEYSMPYPPLVPTCLMNPYAWALLGVLLFSIATGWNRSYRDDKISYLTGWTRFG